jgi:adenylate cyclase
LVKRTSTRHGGRPVKWLGDGVMLHYKDPARGVVAALEMVAGGVEIGLPPLHVGLHAGPVIFQEGDYYGQTVNVASRIADYARPGEVADASSEANVNFREIGPVELKGVAGAIRLPPPDQAEGTGADSPSMTDALRSDSPMRTGGVTAERSY